MTPPPLWLMLVSLPAIYLATYGPGRLLCLAAGLRLRSAQERLGMACAVGAVVLGWVGYLAAVGAMPWLAVGGGWGAIALGLGMVVWEVRRREPCDLQNRQRWVLLLAVMIALALTAGMNWGQISYHEDGSMSGRFVWPDLLYRNAVMSRLMNCDGPPDWPWLAGVPMRGMSLLRFTALVPVMKAVGVTSYHYQVAALWLGLFGVPVAACCCLAFVRALGASATVAAWATVLTAFVGNPRWLLNERFAHSPALHWAGTDVFAMSVPVFFALLALLMLAVRERQRGAVWLALGVLVSGMGFIPWTGLSIYLALPLWFLACLVRRKDIGLSLTLALGAAAGLVVLKVLMGTGTAEGSVLAGVAPSPTIRALNWAFPFLAEPLSPLVAGLDALSVMKLAKFACVYPVAVFFYLWGSMWVRNIILPHAYRFPWRRLGEPEYALGLWLVVAGVLLSSAVDFNRLAYQGAQYDVFRVLWPALMLANVGCALLLVEYGPRLRRGVPLVVLLVLVFYGAWENTQLVLWGRTSLVTTILPAEEMAALRFLSWQAGPGDVVLVDPRHEPGESRFPQIEYAGHKWGYVSGLQNARVWLDNEEMARKFGQGDLWDERHRRLRQAVEEGELGELASREGVRWVVWQDGEPLEDMREVFREGEVRVYEVGG